LVHLGQLATQSLFSFAIEWHKRERDIDNEDKEEYEEGGLQVEFT
jgi:hypothetical protein